MKRLFLYLSSLLVFVYALLSLYQQEEYLRFGSYNQFVLFRKESPQALTGEAFAQSLD